MNHMKPTILLIDTDTIFIQQLSHCLSQHHFNIEISSDGEQATKIALNKTFTAIMTEIVLPKRNGLQILKTIRQYHATPFIVLTAREDTIDKLLAFQFGADDYIHKPCNENELIARLQAIIRRHKHQSNHTVRSMNYDNIHLDSSKRMVTLGNTPIKLTNTEFNILEVLMKLPEQAFSKEELTEFALKRNFTAYDRSIDVHISNLRNKLNPLPKINEHTYIHTIWGFGYQLVRP